MILFLANLVCVSHNPMMMATQLSSSAARALLLSTKDFAATLAGQEGWARASLGGTRFRQRDAPLARAGIYASVYESAGLSLAIAPLAGLGFWHESPTAGASRVADDMIPTAASERALVTNVVEHGTAHHGMPVMAVLGSVSEGREAFEASFRRRVGYALGFHTSLRESSLACYEAWYEPLILGAVASIDGVARRGDEFDRFSALLNLLARLEGTMAYERQHGAPSPQAPGVVRSYREKAAALQTQLVNTSLQLRRRLNTDGRIAVRALLSQLRAERNKGIWNVTTSPVWGMSRGYEQGLLTR